MKVKTLIIVIVAVVLAIAMGASWGSHAQKSAASWGASPNASWGS